MKGVLLDRSSLDVGDIDFSGLEALLSSWRWYDETAPGQQVGERIRGAQVVVSNKVRLDAQTLAQAERLELICVAATGTNNVDLDAARAFGVQVCNVRGYATPSVVQHVFGLILALTTRLNDYQAAVRAGRWQGSRNFCLLDFPIREMAGKRLGIVGYGELGRAVAETAAAFGLELLIARRPGTETPGRVALMELLPQVDVLSLHCPLTPDTRGLIGAEQLAVMQPDALLINTARGGIVDEWALAEALSAGSLGGAGVDVLSAEPPAGGNPLLAGDIPNLIVTPHIAWASRESRQRLVDGIADNIRAFQEGTVINRVD